MQDCFDYLTTYGCGGKGVVLFFSAGDTGIDFTTPLPDSPMFVPHSWAAYERTIAIASSTDMDIRDSNSNFGGNVGDPAHMYLIDLCAPGIGIITCSIVGAGNPILVGHMDGSSHDYQFMGNTSASTPIVAGVAALMLSANPSLTWIEENFLEILQSKLIQIIRIQLVDGQPIQIQPFVDGLIVMAEFLVI
jgi:subtilisin family serine protease